MSDLEIIRVDAGIAEDAEKIIGIEEYRCRIGIGMHSDDSSFEELADAHNDLMLLIIESTEWRDLSLRELQQPPEILLRCERQRTGKKNGSQFLKIGLGASFD